MKKDLFLNLVMLVVFTTSLWSQQTTSAPAIPEEARRHFVIATALFKEAKTPDDYLMVENHFKQAAELAPQWPDPLYNLALAKEAAGDYAGAIADLKLYLQFKLPDAEARAAQDKQYLLEAKLELAERKKMEIQQASDEQARIARQKAAVYEGLDGGVWVFRQVIPGLIRNHTRTTLEIHGNEMDLYISDDLNERHRAGHVTFSSRHFTATSFCNGCAPLESTISDDGQTITEERTEYDGSRGQYVYYREN